MGGGYVGAFSQSRRCTFITHGQTDNVFDAGDKEKSPYVKDLDYLGMVQKESRPCKSPFGKLIRIYFVSEILSTGRYLGQFFKCFLGESEQGVPETP